jgi:hypothetical protein
MLFLRLKKMGEVPIINLFQGMRLSDTALLQSAFAPGAVLQTISKNKEGAVSISTQNIKDFIAKPWLG